MKKIVLVMTGLLFLAACARQPLSSATLPVYQSTEVGSLAPTPSIPTLETAGPSQISPASKITSSPPTTPNQATIKHFGANTSVNPVDIQMTDLSVGWSIAIDQKQDMHILRTLDSGQTWQDVTPPEPASTSRQTGKRLQPFFLDSQNAWAVYWTTDQETGPVFDAKVWYTTDGGQNWKHSTEVDMSAWEGGYAQPAYLDFIDTQNGFLALAHDPGAGHAPISIYRTQDGGANWTIAKEPMDQGDSYIDACCQTGMAFIDPLNGAVTKDPGPVSQTYLVRTRDGGATWSNQEPPPADRQLFESGMCGTFSPQAIQPGILRMVVSCIQDAVPDSPPKAYLYTTSDFGESWKFDALPDPPWDRTTWPTLQRSDETQFLNSAEGWLFTIANYQNPDQGTQQIRTYLYHTPDGGASWESISDLAGSGQFSFIDPQNGWVTLDDNNLISLQRTTDGGISWTEISTMVSPEPDRSVATPIPVGSEIPHLQQNQAFELEILKRVDANLGWALTRTGPSDGHVIRTQNGGASWLDVTPPEPASSSAGPPHRPVAFFLDDQHAWVTYYPSEGAATSPTIIWRTEDGGATWQAGQPLTPGDIEATFSPRHFYFINSREGWLLMTHGVAAGSQPVTLFHTQDGGRTWPRVLDMLSPGSNAINTCCQTGMIFVNPLDGLITTNLGPDPRPHVSWTRDGGKSWLRQDLPLPAEEPSAAMCGTLSPAFIPPNHIFLLLECLNLESPGKEPTYYFYTTTNLGDQWTSNPLPEPVSENNAWRIDSRDLRIEFINSQTGWLFVTDTYSSSDGKSQKMLTHFFQTADSGNTWQSIGRANWGGSFSFIDANLGWAIARDFPQQYAFVNTEDGGRSWQIIRPMISP